MRRRLLNFTAAVSLLSCVAAMVLWTHSYWRDDVFHWRRDRCGVRIASACGRLTVIIESGGQLWSDSYGYTEGRDPGDEKQFWPMNSICGFAWSSERSVVGTYQSVLVPHVAIVTVLAFVPTVWLFVIRRRADRSRMNFCRCCGYNLHGNTSGVCPECGTPIAGKAGMKA